jgi:hypothetical protein
VGTNGSFSKEVNSDEPVLDQLARQIRAAFKEARASTANALAAAMTGGDALFLAKQRGVGAIGWQRWVKQHCGLSLSTARLFMQLAGHRAEIEEKLRDDPDLSLRAARRLIGRPSPNKSTGKTSPTRQESSLTAAAAEVVIAMSDEDWTAALEIGLGFDRFLRVMPPAWRPLLEARAGGQALSRLKQQQPNTRLKRLKLVHDARAAPSH